jgi:hypothetical protein
VITIEQHVLDYAARFVGLGSALDFYNRTSRAADVALAAGGFGFTHHEIAQVSALLSLASRRDASLARLRPLVSRSQRSGLRAAGALLALAEAIARRLPDGELTGLSPEVEGRVLRINLPEYAHESVLDLAPRVKADLGLRLQPRQTPSSEPVALAATRKKRGGTNHRSSADAGPH